MKLKLGDPVRIDWEDAWSNSNAYFTFKNIKEEKPYIGHAVGELIQNDRSGMTVAIECFGNRHRHIEHIPRSLIRKVKRLR